MDTICCNIYKLFQAGTGKLITFNLILRFLLLQGDGWDRLVYKIAYFIDWSKPGAHRDADGVIPAYINGKYIVRMFFESIAHKAVKRMVYCPLISQGETTPYMLSWKDF